MLEYGSSYLSGQNLSFGFLKGKHAIIAVVSSFIGRHFSWPRFILIKSAGWFEITCNIALAIAWNVVFPSMVSVSRCKQSKSRTEIYRVGDKF
jgi:hypothetical protein